MKCPLMSDKDYSEQLERRLHKGDCIKEDCAWWVEIEGAAGCAIALIPEMIIIGAREKLRGSYS